MLKRKRKKRTKTDNMRNGISFFQQIYRFINSSFNTT